VARKYPVHRIVFAAIIIVSAAVPVSGQDSPSVSDQTRECLACHEQITPGIVEDWSKSRMSRVISRQALGQPAQQRRISAKTLPPSLSNTVVGCAECHTLNSDRHKDTFDHNGHLVHTVVTPGDCSVCHPVEDHQFEKNKMSQAYGNLMHNAVYQTLITDINGPMTFDNMTLVAHAHPDDQTNADACLSCHGTKLQVEKTAVRDTVMGEMDFPVISGWPNQGVGRINPDNTRGSCAACHTRHQFSIEMARKPDTCSQCHKGPDVPAYKVYQVSKHGNIYRSLHASSDWDFSSVPWKVGEDFSAPTCAACHVSMLASPSGEIRAERTHQMNDRLSWRIFGLVYAHAHPKSPDTTLIKNKDGLPLPTAFDGTPAEDYLINEETMAQRTAAMKKVCTSCHSTSWTDGHFEKFKKAIATTNADTRIATQILQKGWDEKIVSGLESGDSPFNEVLERKWVEQWLFFANSIRFASAMMGADYGVFANGRWYMSKNAREMLELLEREMAIKAAAEK